MSGTVDSFKAWLNAYGINSQFGVVVLVSIVFLYSAVWIYEPEQESILNNFPRVGKPLLVALGLEKPVHERIARGYREITKPLGKPFLVRWWAQDYLILPPKYLADLTTADDYNVSFLLNLSNALHLHLAAGDLYKRHPNRTVEVVKRGINPQLPRLTIDLALPEINHALAKVIPRASDEQWTSVPVTDTFMDALNRVAVRFMVCEQLAHDDAFCRDSKTFVSSIFVNALTIVGLPLGPFRGLFGQLVGVLYRRRLRRCTRVIEPIIKERIARFDPAKAKLTQLDDAIDWSLALTPNPAGQDPKALATELMFGLWAASSTPGVMVADLIFQVLIFPEYLQPLRDEAEKVVGEHGWSEKTFGQLRLLDSFIRETNRMHPVGSTTACRTVRGQPWLLSDGLKIPVGQAVSFPIKAIQQDPEFIDAGTQFDGFRFAKGDGQQQLASTVDTTNLAFGYGAHACPGRFFAIRVVKMTFAKLLLEYDFKWDGDVKARPEPVLVEGQFLPNMKARILMKRRSPT